MPYFQKGSKNHFFGKKHSEATKKKMSEAHKGIKNPGFGKKLSDQHKKKLSEALKGKECLRGENNSGWKGADVGYHGIHAWLRKYFGNANKCENPNCQYTNPKRFEWALLKGCKYERKKENFWMLCKGCHSQYDSVVSNLKQIRNNEIYEKRK